MAFAVPLVGMLGTAIAGSGTAAATASIGAAALSTAGSVGSAVAGGIGDYQKYQYQAEVAKRNAAIAGQAAKDSLVSGQQQEQSQKLRTGQEVASATVGAAARGVDVGSGSAEDYRSSIQTSGDIEAATQHYNTLRAAYGYDVQQNQYLADRANYKSAATGALVGGLFKGAGSFISGSSSISSQIAGFQQSGALGGG